MPDHDPGQLTTPQLDRYASQLARCLKTLGTDAPIRADVQRELAIVRAEQESRTSPASPAVVLQGLAQVVEQVVAVFDAHRQPDQVARDFELRAGH
jgi:hypothetical protein